MSLIPKYLDKCDTLLIMTVNPGFGGQAFMPEMLEKVSFVREICDKLDLRKGDAPFDIAVDGGVDAETAAQCVAAGANTLVSGSYLFKTPTMAEGVKTLRSVAKRTLAK